MFTAQFPASAATSTATNPFASTIPFPVRPQTSGFRPPLSLSPRTHRTPTEVLIDNSNDRPDISSIAVLGYN